MSFDSRKLTATSLIVYPNPNPGNQLNIQLQSFKKQENVTIRIYDMLGNQIKSLNITTDSNGDYYTSLPLQKSDMIHFYIVRAITGSITKEVKVIIK
jgi:hypothetical protein